MDYTQLASYLLIPGAAFGAFGIIAMVIDERPEPGDLLAFIPAVLLVFTLSTLFWVAVGVGDLFVYVEILGLPAQ